MLVTGASSGIGRATVLRLAANGYHVFGGVLKSRDGAARAEAAGDVTPVILDVTGAQQIASAVELIAGHIGDAGLAGLAHNAGVGVFGPLELIPIEQFRRQLEVNVSGRIAITQAALPLLRRAHGRIAMIDSTGTRFTPPFVGPLAASKSTLTTMSAALRQELAPWDIRVTVVEPGSIRSEAVDKLDSDARAVMSEATAEGRALDENAFLHLVGSFARLHEGGSPPGNDPPDRPVREWFCSTSRGTPAILEQSRGSSHPRRHSNGLMTSPLTDEATAPNRRAA